MLKLTILVSALALSLGAFAEVPVALPEGYYEVDSVPAALQPAVQRTAKYVGQIQTRIKGLKEILSFGTGFVAAPGNQVFTNHHVIADHLGSPKVFALYWVTAEGEQELTEVLSDDSVRDIASLKLPAPLPDGLRFADREALLGTPILSIGYPFAYPNPKATFGNIIQQDGDFFTTSTRVLAGQSGSPVISLVTDEVVGVVRATHARVKTGESADAYSDQRIVLNRANHAFKSKVDVPNPKEAFKIRKGLIGLDSRALQEAFSLHGPTFYSLTVFSTSYLSSHRMDASVKKLEGFRDVGQNVLRRVRAGDLPSVYGPDLESFHRAMVNYAASLIPAPVSIPNLPLQSPEDLAEMVSEAGAARAEAYLEAAVEALDGVIQGQADRFQNELARMEFFLKLDRIARTLIEVGEDPARRETAAFLNRYYFETPSIGVRSSAIKKR